MYSGCKKKGSGVTPPTYSEEDKLEVEEELVKCPFLTSRIGISSRPRVKVQSGEPFRPTFAVAASSKKRHGYSPEGIGARECPYRGTFPPNIQLPAMIPFNVEPGCW